MTTLALQIARLKCSFHGNSSLPELATARGLAKRGRILLSVRRHGQTRRLSWNDIRRNAVRTRAGLPIPPLAPSPTTLSPFGRGFGGQLASAIPRKSELGETCEISRNYLTTRSPSRIPLPHPRYKKIYINQWVEREAAVLWEGKLDKGRSTVIHSFVVDGRTLGVRRGGVEDRGFAVG